MRQQRGVSLLVVMVALVLMLATSVSILRNTGSSMHVVGHMGFKQNASSVADLGVERARAWLMAQSSANLAVAQAGGAYFETWAPGFDPLSYDWNAAGHSVLATADDGTGNAVRYVIHRMCAVSGAITDVLTQCVPVPPANGVSGTNLNGGGFGVGLAMNTAYRITVRVAGPGNSLSYVQVMVH